MKMSEHFPYAFQVEHNKSFEVQDATWYSYGEKYESDGDQDSAIEHAVLSHDRMADEIAELREALKENERLITYLIENLSVKELEGVEDKIVEVSLKNLKLLNK